MDQPRLIKVGVVILLAVVFFVPFFGAQNFSPATDEITHLPSGYSYWKTGQITLNPQHPPLIKLLSSFPLLFMDLKFDPQDQNLTGPLKNEWAFGDNFLSSNNADQLLFWGRLPVMLLSVLLAFYLFKWASEMFSPQAGLLSLFLYAFTPNIIAHAQLVTTDLALASFSFVSFYYLWKFFKTELKKFLIYAGLFMGLALSSKFSAIFMLMASVILVLMSKSAIHPLENSRAKSRGSRVGGMADLPVVRTILIFGLSALAVVYSVYFFPSDPGFYLKGLKTVYADWKPGYNFYLNGQFSPDGWWYYFFFAFLIKTPIPTLVAFIFSLLLYKKFRFGKWDKMFIFLPLLLFTLATSLKAHNVSIRYLIPAFPFVLLYSGGLAQFFNLKPDCPLKGLTFNELSTKRLNLLRIGKLGLILILAGWLIFSSVRVYPDYMAYFNELAGGSDNGYKYLDDSNIEWGHDLKRMGKYQVQNPDTRVVYSWKNSNPEYYGVENFMMADDSGWWREPKGQYAVNTFLLIRMQLLSQQRNDPDLNWLALYEPVGKIGQSFFVYDFK